MVKRSLVSLIAIAWATSAAAQGAPDARPPARSADETTVGEIIVTAQRRSERLVDVPISISTATAEDLERAGGASIENLTKVTPGIVLERAQYGLSPTVRGIGSTLSTSGGEQIVSLYVDEIYYPTPTGNVFDLASVAGVELLKGPQGTLFGRNATGGAILLRTLDPDTTEMSGRVNASWERFNQIRTSAYLNMPISDKVAVNASVAYRYSQGYVRDLKDNHITNQGDSFTLRGKLLFKPTDDFSVILTAAHADFDDPSGTTYVNRLPAPLLSLLPVGPISTDRFHSSKDMQEVVQTQTDEFSARAKLDVAGGTISSFTAFLRNKLNATNDLDGSYLPQSVSLKVRTKTFTQEVNFASDPDQPLTYVVGAYYFRNRAQVPTLTSNGAPLFNTRGNNDAIAGYVDGTYKFGDLSLIAGVRYTREKRRAFSAFGVDAPSPFTRIQEAVDKQWTPRVGLRYALGEQANIYATYSKGFKSGSFDSTSPSGPGVKPETVDAFEVGYKMSKSGLSFNAAAFYYNYQDTQVNATVSGENGAIFSQLFNVPKSRIYGAEADSTFRVTDNFDVRLAAAYTHARYIDFTNAPGWVRGPAVFVGASLDVSGNNMVRAPELTASATFSYHREIGDNNELEITLSPYYSGRVYYTFDNTNSQSPYMTLDGAVSLTIAERTKVSIFGRNLTDVDYKTTMAQNALGLNFTVFAPPRVFGLSLGYSF